MSSSTATPSANIYAPVEVNNGYVASAFAILGNAHKLSDPAGVTADWAALVSLEVCTRIPVDPEAPENPFENYVSPLAA